MIPYQMIYRAFGICLLISATFTECKKIHELMTEDEILNVFHTTLDAVPEYEVVPIEHSLHRRSTPKNFRLRFKAFDKDVDLYLNPNDGVLVGEDTPVWIAEEYSGRLHYRKLKKGIMKEVLGVYQSLPGKAALVVRAREDGNLTFDGTVDDLMVIPLPYSVEEEMRRAGKFKRDLPSTNRSTMITKYHIVLKSNKWNNQTNKAQLLNESSVSNVDDISKKIDYWRSRDVDKTIVFPTVLVTTDFDVTVKSKEDSQYYDQIIYQLAFWNAVDLRYRHLSKPKVRLRIAGLIIGSGRSATPYVNDHIVDGQLELFPAIEDMHIYWNLLSYTRDFSSEGYHIVATATNLKLFDKDSAGVKKMYGGLATIASLCNNNIGSFYPALLFDDDRSFGGINVAVHELGHILGTSHDEEADGECLAVDGYLMAPVISTTENNPKWSKCSLKWLSAVLRTKHCADQPKDYYPPGKPLGKILPGTVKTIEEQCQARGYHWACEPTPGICKNLKCWNSGFHSFFTTFLSCQTSHSAAEGTECAPGRVCLDGECRSLYSSESH